eukprot:2372917-Amphidinium_carterae.1
MNPPPDSLCRAVPVTCHCPSGQRCSLPCDADAGRTDRRDCVHCGRCRCISPPGTRSRFHDLPEW